MDTMLELLAEKAQLEARLAKLNELIRKNRASKSQRNQYKTVKGQIKAITTKVNAARTVHIKEVRIKKIQVKAVKQLQSLKIKQPTMTREQVFAIYRHHNTERFLERIIIAFPELAQSEDIMRFHLDTAGNTELYDMLKKYQLRSTWFDSDGSWDAGELSGWSSQFLLLAIKGVGTPELRENS